VNEQATAAGNKKVAVEEIDPEAHMDFLTRVEAGLVPGYEIMHKFGKHEDVGATYEPLAIHGVYQTVQPANATTLRVKAGNVNDDAGGTGARSIMLLGLDETGAEATESLAPNGAAAGAAGAVTWIRLPRAYIAETGTYAAAGADSQAADIVIETTGGVEWLTIHKPDVGRGQSQVGLFPIPLGKTGYVLSYLLTTDSNKAVDFLFFKREGILDAAPPYQARRTIIEEIGVQGHLEGSFRGGQKIPELTDLGWMAKADAAASVTVDFEILLIDN